MKWRFALCRFNVDGKTGAGDVDKNMFTSGTVLIIKYGYTVNMLQDRYRHVDASFLGGCTALIPP